MKVTHHAQDCSVHSPQAMIEAIIPIIIKKVPIIIAPLVAPAALNAAFPQMNITFTSGNTIASKPLIKNIIPERNTRLASMVTPVGLDGGCDGYRRVIFFLVGFFLLKVTLFTELYTRFIIKIILQNLSYFIVPTPHFPLVNKICTF